MGLDDEFTKLLIIIQRPEWGNRTPRIRKIICYAIVSGWFKAVFVRTTTGEMQYGAERSVFVFLLCWGCKKYYSSEKVWSEPWSEVKVLPDSDVFRRYWGLGPDEDERGELRASKTISRLLCLEKDILCVNGIETSLPLHIWSVYAPAISSVTLVAKIFDLAYTRILDAFSLPDNTTLRNPGRCIEFCEQPLPSEADMDGPLVDLENVRLADPNSGIWRVKERLQRSMLLFNEGSKLTTLFILPDSACYVVLQPHEFSVSSSIMYYDAQWEAFNDRPPSGAIIIITLCVYEACLNSVAFLS
ncbi:hypothetical protein ARMGADRAFT_1035505 [Armillaria gallica]|uniref:Uncharacterized protein n=1 Tax=Armillaria gallica TaxID=47427 RepID=A0A2H3DEH0_ARMGA|nr:hypothetical protein ARMGADRAFT_1035505 [Armillaria gallica]